MRGDVTITREGDHTVIRASDGSIIQHLSFDVLSHETVQFIQPSELSRVLNRITGPEPTRIDGSLLANGQVYLVNPAGVAFGPNATVNVGSLTAAAGSLSNADFVRGVDHFTSLQGSVVNEGSIHGGTISLIGEHVANHGDISSESGVVAMLAGNDVLLTKHGERITIRIDGADLQKHVVKGHDAGASPVSSAIPPGVENTGSISVKKGRVVLGAGDLYALAIRNTGRIESSPGHLTVASVGDGAIEGDFSPGGADDGGEPCDESDGRDQNNGRKNDDESAHLDKKKAKKDDDESDKSKDESLAKDDASTEEQDEACDEDADDDAHCGDAPDAEDAASDPSDKANDKSEEKKDKACKEDEEDDESDDDRDEKASEHDGDDD
ncbi:MAG: two-partner secretion domain-containing protein, partial [Planctomycetota bacterium]